MSERLLYLHAGTHKTATTSIQAFLGSNQTAFRRAGIYLPRTGRLDPRTAAQHNVAWELGGDPRFDPARGTVRQLLEELATTAAPRVVISSEDLGLLHADPRALGELDAAFRRLGFETRVVFYLRPQSAYIESLYVELLKNGCFVDFAGYVERIVATGSLDFRELDCVHPFRHEALFEYDRLLDAFAGVFTRRRIIARRFRGGRELDFMLRDFTELIGSGLAIDFESLDRPPRLNALLDFAGVMELLDPGAPVAAAQASAPFDAMHLAETLRILARFWGSNRRLERRYGIRLPAATWPELIHDAAIACGLVPGGGERKRLLQAASSRLTALPRRDVAA